MTERLIKALHLRRHRRVAALLQQGASPSTPAADGTTPLYLAAVSGRADLVRLLLEAGAAPDEESRGEPGSEGLPLCAAACRGDAGAVRELLAHGADPNLREDNATGSTPLMWAIEGAHVDIVRLLLAANADPDAGHHGRTPLMLAAEQGSTRIVQALVCHGADPHLTDALGRSALQTARERGHKGIETELHRTAG
ncbi:ankyrin repeat domain-containing protein [Streptomyces sp. TM32]|uniref:ankyrin repeat domain-containing protein n=1 Tax=Streptomyces sp. TM32 TaxID=1652669 RepID=UPI0023B95954|nr:ankyrin repeat domain-containing protein [Streptomyces sp. TM32]